MSFTLFFPRQGSDGAYKDLIEEHEVYEAVLEEVRKSISDMGSEGYDLLEPEFPWKAGSGNIYLTVEELNACYEQDGRIDDMEEYTMLCHERGIEKATTLWAPDIFKELWVRYRVGEGDTAVDDVTYAKLPDGTTIALRDEAE